MVAFVAGGENTGILNIAMWLGKILHESNENHFVT